MKRIILIFTGLILSLGLFAQIPQRISDDIQIRKRNPRLYLNNNWLGTAGNVGTTLYFNGVKIGGAAGEWGGISGTLSDQIDLQDALDLKATIPAVGIPFSTGIGWGASITNNSANWNTAYADRLKWDGGSTGLVAATGRTSLGATTVGNNIFTLPNPSAIRFLLINANNSVTAQSATDFKTSLSLQNVTNESKATMFLNPTFAGDVTIPNAPVNASDGVNKGYVDGILALGMIWVAPVEDIVAVLADAIPLGDRYILSTDGHIYVSDGDDTWTDLGATVEGTACYVKADVELPDNLVGQYNYNGVDWVYIGSSGNHNDLTNIQGGTAAEYYHLTQAQNTLIENATTVGGAFLNLTNPSAITIPLINADNSITPTSTTGKGNFVRSIAPSFSTSMTLTDGNLVLPENGLVINSVNHLYGLTDSIANTHVPYTGANKTVDLGDESLVTTGNIGGDESRVNHGYYDYLTSTNEFRGDVNGDSINWVNLINPTIYKMQFRIDTTANAPVAGDSTFTDPRFIDYHLGISREGELQYQNTAGVPNITDGFRFNNATGEIIFRPVFATNEKIIINASNSIVWETITPQVSYCAAYQAVYDAMTNKPSEAVATAQNKLVYRLDTLDYEGGDSYWATRDKIHVPATEVNTGNEALINWADPGTFNATNISSTAWTTLRGYTGDGVADYISTNWNPSTDATHYTLNDAAISIYLRIDQQEGTVGGTGVFGVDNGGYRIELIPRNTSGNYVARINSSSGTSMTKAIEGSDGFFVLTRTASDACSLYRNGALVETETDASAGVPNAYVYVLHTNGLAGYSTNQFSYFDAGKGVSAGYADAVNTIIEDYMDDPAIGAGVQ